MRVLLVLLVAAPLACVVPQQMLASPGDLRDYRAFREAAQEGSRLAAAQRYLRRHPEGAWEGEVRTVFDAEEAAWFEVAKVSRSRAREYVVDLPDGPHAEAARSLLVLFDEHQADVETLTLLADARRTAATLDIQAARRKRVSDVLLAALAALLDPATWGARLEAPPATLAAALQGDVPVTWGAALSSRHVDRLYFVLPTPDGSQARELEASLQLVLDRGRVVQGTLSGADLFVLWTEAIETRVLDPNDPTDRALARTTIADLLSGALEATVPASRCAREKGAEEVISRACDGWAVSVRMGSEAGEVDIVDVVGPRKPDAAPAASASPAHPPSIRAQKGGMR
jgi:hypothetical protein